MSEPKLKEIHDARGRLIIREWLIDDKLHREDGPARLWYYEDGKIELESYYVNGQQTNKEELIKYARINELVKRTAAAKKIKL